MIKQEKEWDDQYVGKFFYTSGIPFDVALNSEFWVIFHFLKSELPILIYKL